MAVGVNPLKPNSWTYEYSTNQGGAYSTLQVNTSLRDVIPDEFARKVIERLILGQDAVLHHLGKVNYGFLEVVFEHHSAQTTTTYGWFTTNNTEIWIRATAEDAGTAGTGSIILFKGTVASYKLPDMLGDNETAVSRFKLKLYAVTFTAATGS
jgi:hypothetical protein